MAKRGAMALALLCTVLLVILGHCEMSVYPGLRRKPLRQFVQQPFDVSSDYLAQLMEENARRRLQQTFGQQLERINTQMSEQEQREKQRHRWRQHLQMLVANNPGISDYENIDVEGTVNREDIEIPNSFISFNSGRDGIFKPNYYVDSNGDYKYKYPAPSGRIQFAVAPSDPRFYERESDENKVSGGNSDELDSRALDDYQEFVPAESQNIGTKTTAAVASANVDAAATAATGTDAKLPVLAPAPVENSKLIDGGAATFHRIKPQNAAAAAAVGGANVAAAMKPNAQDATDDGNNSRQHISVLIDKLQKEGKSATIINNHGSATALGGGDESASMVVRQHLGVDGEIGMYLMALIAGLSAAVTVGLIALGIAWVTLRRKSKAAADVEYPAYGVTGPNKDISPSGDRKLAQSAQMYHYQHQKQQIIAMENRQAAEGSCGMSDVESDDEENEEGDYTVYECPGLAPPMGEMEVKNPLFLDETPVTPSSNITTTTATSTTTTTSTPTIAHNITHATPQQPPTQQLGKKPTYKVVVGAAPNPKATSTEFTSSEENSKKKKNKK